jgi:protein tyrosine phosphatase (PTP) superfamily phosphohydrolase (DUF442 family)
VPVRLDGITIANIGIFQRKLDEVGIPVYSYQTQIVRINGLLSPAGVMEQKRAKIPAV